MFAMADAWSDCDVCADAESANKVRNKKANIRIEEGGRFIRGDVFAERREGAR